MKTIRSNIRTTGLLERENIDNGCKKTLTSQEKFPELKDMSLLPDWKGLWVPSTMDENEPDHATSDHQGWWLDSTRFQTENLFYINLKSQNC